MPMTECSTHVVPSDYRAACRYLESFINYEQKRDFQYNPRTLNLVRMESLLSSLDNPHLALNVVHVAGSKGKGSTAAMIASILQAAGYRTGLYTSPHLISPRERFRVDNDLIRESLFCGYVQRLQLHLERMRRDGNAPTFFEIYTAIAFLYFQETHVDWAVLEVGLGGRLDATNVILAPRVSVITPISLEHTHILGHHLSEIAWEKAGIVKTHCPVILAPQPEEAREVLLKVCHERQAPVSDVAECCQIGVVDRVTEGQRFELTTARHALGRVTVPLLGAHQRLNAAVAVSTVEVLPVKELPEVSVGAEAIRVGLSRVAWPGRLQKIPGTPSMVLDGAHSPESARVLCRSLREDFQYDRLICVVGLSQDKDLAGFGRELSAVADLVILTRASDMPRAVDPSGIAKEWDGLEFPITVAPTAEEAMQVAVRQARAGDLICVTGSLYLVGEVLERLGYQPDGFLADVPYRQSLSGLMQLRPQERECSQTARPISAC